MDDYFEDNSRPDGPGSDRAPTEHTITMTGTTHDELVQAVLSALGERTAARISREQEQTIRTTIERCVDEAVKRIADRELDSEIRRIIDQGWEEYTSWGERTGKKFTLADRVTAYLKEQVDGNGSRTDYRGKERYRHLFEVAINGAFRGEVGKTIDAFIAEAKKMLDDEFKSRFAKAMKSALGM